MNTSKNTESDVTKGVRKWPWWGPYVFTAFAAAAFVALLVVFGFIAEIPFALHVLFALMTLADDRNVVSTWILGEKA